MNGCLFKAQSEQKVVSDWKTLKVNEKLLMICNEFDGSSVTPCTVTEVCEDHVIAIEDCDYSMRPQTLWIDNFNQDLFVYSE